MCHGWLHVGLPPPKAEDRVQIRMAFEKLTNLLDKKATAKIHGRSKLDVQFLRFTAKGTFVPILHQEFILASHYQFLSSSDSQTQQAQRSPSQAMAPRCSLLSTFTALDTLERTQFKHRRSSSQLHCSHASSSPWWHRLLPSYSFCPAVALLVPNNRPDSPVMLSELQQRQQVYSRLGEVSRCSTRASVIFLTITGSTSSSVAFRSSLVTPSAVALPTFVIDCPKHRWSWNHIVAATNHPHRHD